MSRKFLPLLLVVALLSGFYSLVSAAERRVKPSPNVISQATIGPSLQAKLDTLQPVDSVGTVIVAFDTVTGLQASHLTILQGVGALKIRTLPTLGMAAFPATVAQVNALKTNPNIVSIWGNDRLSYHMHQARVLCGVDRMRADPNFIALNGGVPIDGHGSPYNFPNPPNTGNAGPQLQSLVINDSGIDATHPDLIINRLSLYQGKTIANVQITTDEATIDPTVPTPVTYTDNVDDTDVNVGHGTHCAGIATGTGTFAATTADPTHGNSFTNFGGVAGARGGNGGIGTPATEATGVKLIGTGSGAVLFILNALGGFEYSLQKQFDFNIRIISNSFGSQGPFNPNNPLSKAIKIAHDRGITVVFAAGNSGPGVDTMSDSPKSPYCIAVAAGNKEGGLAYFSSRGTPKSERLGNSDPNDDFNAPAITAPGNGREFETNSAKLSAAIVATRSTSNVFANGLNNDVEIPAAYARYYTQIQGTSMACPFIAGTCALLLDANPNLTPDQLKQILVDTATPMPDYAEHECGAGYVNVYAAVDKVFNTAKAYTQFSAQRPAFNSVVSNGPTQPVEPFAMPYSPNNSQATSYASAVANANQYPNHNAYKFTITLPTPQPGQAAQGKLDVRIQFAMNPPVTSNGNTLSLRLWAPDGKTYSSLFTIPILEANTQQVVVKDPIPGVWVAEVRGVTGNDSLPDNVTGQVFRTSLVINEPPDITDAPQRDAIDNALINFYLDILPSGNFGPKERVTRGDLAGVLADNTALRQTVNASPRFSDVSGYLLHVSESVTENGATLRDFNFTPAPLMPTSGSLFRPGFFVSRIEVATALVRALGHDLEAAALNPAAVTVVNNGTTYPVIDTGELDSASLGYLQFALDRGLLDYVLAPGMVNGSTQTVAYARPAKQIKRGELAAGIVNYRAAFRTGN